MYCIALAGPGRLPGQAHGHVRSLRGPAAPRPSPLACLRTCSPVEPEEPRLTPSGASACLPRVYAAQLHPAAVHGPDVRRRAGRTEQSCFMEGARAGRGARPAPSLWHRRNTFVERRVFVEAAALNAVRYERSKIAALCHAALYHSERWHPGIKGGAAGGGYAQVVPMEARPLPLPPAAPRKRDVSLACWGRISASCPWQ